MSTPTHGEFTHRDVLARLHDFATAHATPRSFRACGDQSPPPVDSALMSRIDGLRSAFPLRLAQTYGEQRTMVAARSRSASTPVESITNIAQTASITDRPAPGRSAAIDGLVAARVAAPISFPDGDRLFASASQSGRSSADALPFYIHPADKNTAATAVTVGRILDITA